MSCEAQLAAQLYISIIQEDNPGLSRFLVCDQSLWWECRVGDAVHRSSLHRFSRSIRQMTSFRASMCILGVPKTK